MANHLVDLLVEDVQQGRDLRSMRGILDTVAAAYPIQDAVIARLGPICGRKIALNAPALLEKAGIDAPVVGFIRGASPFESGAHLCISDYKQLALEPEFVAILSKDIPAGASIEPAELMGVVERFCMGFEVMDKRNGPADPHAPTFIANNVFNAGCVVSDMVLDPDILQSGAYETRFSAAGQVKLQGQGTAPQNPIEACAFVINDFTSRGHSLSKGEAILCGSHLPPLPISVAGQYVFSLSTGAAVSLSISD